MPTNFLEAAGTNGFITTPFNLMSTELNTLGSGIAATSSVGGTSGVFNQTNFAQGIWGLIYFQAGGAFTPTAGGSISGWWLMSPNGGTNYETSVVTASTTVLALPRVPDFMIPLSAAAYASGNIAFAPAFIKLPWPTCKVLIQNNSGAALPSSGNLIVCGPVATQY